MANVNINFVRYCKAFLEERCGLNDTEAQILVLDPELGPPMDEAKRHWVRHHRSACPAARITAELPQASLGDRRGPSEWHHVGPLEAESRRTGTNSVGDVGLREVAIMPLDHAGVAVA